MQSSPDPVALPLGITSDLVYASALNQWCRHTQEIYCAVDQQHHPGAIILDIAIKHPFLLHGILALSTFHLGITDPALHDAYIAHSHRILAQGMEGFNAVAANGAGFDETNIMGAFIFANVAGLCKFAHLFSTMHDSVAQFIDRFIDTIAMLRGVNIVLGPWWPLIVNSALFKALNPPVGIDQQTDVDATETPELSKARAIVSHADFDIETKRVCEKVVTQLQIMYNEYSQSELETEKPQFPESVWFIRLPTEFHALLLKKQPEALIIVAHVAPLLHHRRKHWIVRNAGEVLVNGISDFLGPAWSTWLEEIQEPIQPVFPTHNSPTKNT